MIRESVVASGVVIDEDMTVTFAELCRFCAVDGKLVVDMVNEGVIEPIGEQPESWRFRGVSIRRAQVAARLIRDLQVNLAGAALAVDLLEELEQLRGGWLYR